jgi:asparagine synthase (glutamine-hydrolysing)
MRRESSWATDGWPSSTSPSPQVAELMGLDVAETRASVEQSYARLCPGTANGAPGARAFNDLGMKRYLHDQLLRDGDVSRMAHARELRVPYLDHTLVESAVEILLAFKLDHGLSKPLFLHAIGEAVLMGVGRRRKQGFTLSLDRWMKQHTGTLEAIALQGERFESRTERRLWHAVLVGRLHWPRGWALVVLEAQRYQAKRQVSGPIVR